MENYPREDHFGQNWWVLPSGEHPQQSHNLKQMPEGHQCGKNRSIFAIHWDGGGVKECF